MFIQIGDWRPITCSKCGSSNAVKPLNEQRVEVRCGDCGHTKLTPEAEAFDRELEQGSTRSWTYEKSDKPPTF